MRPSDNEATSRISRNSARSSVICGSNQFIWRPSSPSFAKLVNGEVRIVWSQWGSSCTTLATGNEWCLPPLELPCFDLGLRKVRVLVMWEVREGMLGRREERGAFADPGRFEHPACFGWSQGVVCERSSHSELLGCLAAFNHQHRTYGLMHLVLWRSTSACGRPLPLSPNHVSNAARMSARSTCA